MQNGVLNYSWANYPGRSDCLVVPTALRPGVLYYSHDSKGSAGHLGQKKTLDRLKQSFFWYGMSNDSDVYVKQCMTCKVNKKGNRTPRSPLETYQAGYPMERVHLDILGPINPRSKSGLAYILVMVDQFTKLVQLAALPAQNAEMTADAFLKHFIVTFGCPLEVHTDQGRNFDSDLFQAFCKVLEITKTRTTPYHPSGNGQVEVFNRVILQMIRSDASRGVKDWDEHLPLIAMTPHSMKNKSTGFSANMLMLGREVVQPIDLILGLPRPTPQDPPTWVENVSRNLSNAHKLDREKIGDTQLRQKRDYDLRVFERSYKEGDVVYLRDSSTQIGISLKMRPPCIGPYLVTRARPPVYTLMGNHREQLVHHNRLKPCHDAQFPLGLQRKRHQILNTLPLDEVASQEMDPDVPSQDSLPGGGLFDPDQTLPYMWGDDPDMTLSCLFDGQDRIPNRTDSSLVDDTTDITNIPSCDSDSDSDGEMTFASPSEPRTTRTGREINLPARYRE